MYRKIALHPALMPYVSRISIQENGTVETPIDAYRVFPSPSPVMGFQRGKLDETFLKDIWAAGITHYISES